VAVGGDPTFRIDEVAESLIEEMLAAEGDIAYYSEDRGMITHGRPRAVLIIDPIDGTRPAAAGLEACCVSVAAAPMLDSPTLGDVSFGCVWDIKTDFCFTARRGGGVKCVDGAGGEVALSPVSAGCVERMFWTSGLRGRPAIATICALSELIDRSSVTGASFDIGSAAYGMTRVLTGQLDAYVDIGDLLVREVAGMEKRFRKVGAGAVLNNSPYDVAPCVLMFEEMGIPCTDGRGRSLSGCALLGSTAEYQVSVLAVADEKLHSDIVAAVGRGVERLDAGLRSGTLQRLEPEEW